MEFSLMRSFGTELKDFGICKFYNDDLAIYVTGKVSYRTQDKLLSCLRNLKTKYMTDENNPRRIKLISLYEYYTHLEVIQQFITNKCIQRNINGIKFLISRFHVRKTFAEILNEMIMARMLKGIFPIKIFVEDYISYKFLLAQCGDIESNPGPVRNLQEILYKKIKIMENFRQREMVLQKKMVRKNFKQRAFDKKKFEFQFNPLGLLSGLTNQINDLGNMKEDAAHVLSQLTTILPEFVVGYNNVFDNANVALEKVYDISNKISAEKSVIGTLLQADVDDLSWLVVLISCLSILALFCTGQKCMAIGVLIILLYFKFPTEIITKVSSFFHNKNEIELQDGFVDFIPIIGQTLFTIFAFSGISLIPQEKYYDSLIRRLDLIPKAATGLTKIWETAGQLFKTTSDEFKIYVLQQSREEVYGNELVTSRLKEIVERINYYTDFKNKRELEKDEVAVDEIGKIYDELYRIQFDGTKWSQLSADNQRIVLQLKPIINELHKAACQSSVHEGGFRKKPIAVFFSGSSQIGKSFITVPMAIALLKRRGYKNSQQIMQEIYYRCAETEYIVGWTNPKIAIYDDYGQIRDMPGKPNPEFFEAIRFINDAPAQIHGAAVHEKNRFFGSEIMIFNSNIEKNFKAYISSVVCPSAVLNRFSELAFRVHVHPNYQKKVVLPNGNIEIKLDTSLCGKNADGTYKCSQCNSDDIAKKKVHGFCPHLYLFDKYNPLNDVVELQNLKASDVFKMIADADEQNRFESTDKLGFYNWMAENDYEFQMKDLSMENMMSYKKKNGHLAQDIFYDTCETEELLDGHIDLENPFDCYGVDTLIKYIDALEFTGITNPDEILAEIAKYPDLFNIYARRVKYGMIGYLSKPNRALAETLDTMEYDKFTRHFKEQFKEETWKDTLKRLLQNAYVFAQNLLKKPIFLAITLISLLIGMFFIFRGSEEITIDTKHEDNIAFEIIPESSSSASIPLKNAKILVENSSAHVPLKNNKISIENSSAHIPLKHKVINVENSSASVPLKNARIKLESYLDQGCLDVENVICKFNLYNMHTDTAQLGNVLFIRGTTILMNKHYLDNFNCRENIVIHLSNVHGQRLCSFNSHDVSDDVVILMKNGEPTDACLVSFNNMKSKVFPHRDLVNKFIKTADLSNLTGKYMIQLPTYGGTTNDFKSITKRTGVDCQMFENIIHVQQDKNGVNYDTYFNNYWQYFCSTIAGDCGAPVLLNNVGAAHKIVGIHCGSLTSSSQGYAQTITQEMLQEGLTKLHKKNLIQVNLESGFEQREEYGSVPFGKGLIVHGCTKKKVVCPNETKIIESPLHGYRTTLTKPAYLRKGKYGDPMEIGLKKYCKETPLLDYNLIKMASQDVRNTHNINVARLDRTRYARLLTWEETVLGVDGDEFMAPLNRGTSMGYPYVQDFPGASGKRNAFGNDEYTLDSPLAKKIFDDCKKLEKDCENGIQGNVFWSDTLKDERRPIEKVDAGKTRVFCAGPVHFTMTFRKYFLGFCAWIMHNRNFNDVSTGTNVYSDDWNVIANLLKSRGKFGDKINVAAGDFSNFDGSLNSMILWSILEDINDWYSAWALLDMEDLEDEELDKAMEELERANFVRHVLWTHIVHSIHINGDVVLQLTHSQPSGCPGTAIINSEYGKYLVRMTYILAIDTFLSQPDTNMEIDKLRDFCRKIRNMQGYHKYVKAIVYGDDNLIGISESILFFYNQETITKEMLKLGHDYTDEAKSGKSYFIRDLSEVQFLKRKFTFDPLVNRYIAPLNLDTVLEICQWTKRGLLSDTITTSNVDVVMRELSLHSEEIWKKWMPKIVRACSKNGITYRFMTQQEYKDTTLDNGLGFKIIENKSCDLGN